MQKTIGNTDPEFLKALHYYQQQRLRSVKWLREQAYSKENTEHEELLMRLWSAAFPEVQVHLFHNI